MRSRGSRVTRVIGQLTDGSRGSRVKKCDPLSSLAGTSAVPNVDASVFASAPMQLIPEPLKRL